MNYLVLTVTRACNLRCVYCPTVKDDWPSLTAEDAVAALDLFVRTYGRGDIKLFGGEPLLVPDVVRAVMDAAASRAEIRRIYLSTNGLPLTREWLAYLRTYPKAVLTVSLDGPGDRNRKLRRPLDGVPDAYDHIVGLLPELLTVPRVVLTQTIAPPEATRAEENLRHLLGLGFWRFNLLPGYYIPWRDRQLAALRENFHAIGTLIENRWAAGERFYLRNLFTIQPTPFFNTGMIVDADGTIHPSNVGLSGSMDELLDATRVGSLAHPPTRQELDARSQEVNGLIKARVPQRIWDATMAVDAELTTLCQRLYPSYARYLARRRRSAA